MLPESLHCKDVAQDFNPALFVGASQIDHQPRGWLLPIEHELFWKRSAGCMAMMSARQMLTVGAGETTGGLAEGRQVLMMKSRPNLFLPQAVEILDDPLKTHFQWRQKHGSDFERQAQAHPPPTHSRMFMSSPKTHVIVKLRKLRKAVLPPMGL